jgi:hypothetical protein
MAKKGRNQRQMGDIGEFRPTKIPIAPKRASLSGGEGPRVPKKERRPRRPPLSVPLVFDAVSIRCAGRLRPSGAPSPRFSLRSVLRALHPSFIETMAATASSRLPAAGLPRFEMRISAKREEVAWPLLTGLISRSREVSRSRLSRRQTDRAAIQDLYRTWIRRHRTQQCRAGADGITAAVAGRESRR